MKKRKLKYWVKVMLLIIAMVLGTSLLLNAVIENHHYLLETRYAIQK